MTSTLPAAARHPRRLRRASGKIAAQTFLIVAIFFAAMAAPAAWPQFSGDSEDLVVQTVLQMRNGGPHGSVWWVPMLGDEPRSKKPPLPTWISAAAVTSATVHGLASTDPAIRESAYRWLAWEVRWPALLAACGMLIATGCLALLLGGPAHVIPSVLIFGTSLMFLRFTRSATTDVHLALWVLTANAFLALAVIRNRLWLGCVGAGAALGLALMCKGPVALVESLLPFATFLLLQHLSAPQSARPSLAPSRPTATLPALAGTVTMLAIALPWPLSVFLRNPHTLSTWLTEIDRRGAAVASHAPPFVNWFAYLTLLPNLLPWLPIFIAGIYLIAKNFRPKKRIAKPITLALLLVIVPIVFLSFFPDRKERYLLPMAGPAAIVAAYAATRMKRAFPPRDFNAKLVWTSYWAILLILAIGLPIAAPILLKGRQGERVFPIFLQAFTLIIGLAIVGWAILKQSHARQSFLYAGASLMLLLNAFFLYGWSQSVAGLSEMKPVADRIHAAFPTGNIVYFDPPPGGKPVTLDLDIYLDRPVPVLSIFPANDKSVAAVVMLDKPGQAMPNFPNWQTWSDLISRNHHWYIVTPAKPG
jgi:4-amino-4-deoxy-L-arabinose transferase-like glycosyltransferase